MSACSMDIEGWRLQSCSGSFLILGTAVQKVAGPTSRSHAVIIRPCARGIFREGSFGQAARLCFQGLSKLWGAENSGASGRRRKEPNQGTTTASKDTLKRKWRVAAASLGLRAHRRLQMARKYVCDFCCIGDIGIAG